MTSQEDQGGGGAPLQDIGNGTPFELNLEASQSIPILIAAPHGGRSYSEAVEQSFRDPACKTRLEDRYVDLLAAEVARASGAALLVAKAPRAEIDLNRAPDDVDWGMISGEGEGRTSHSLANRRARSGLGLVPRRLPGLGEIWRGPIERTELDRRIETIHHPYHSALGRALETLRDRWGAVLLVDLHSMPPLNPKAFGGARPEFVIGDRFGTSCSGTLSAGALSYLSLNGRLATHNRPYSGGYVLDRHGMPKRGLHAIQIEVCRSLYLDRHLDQPSARLGGVGRLLGGLVKMLGSEVANLRSGGQFAEAAE